MRGWGGKVDFFISKLNRNEGIKMHKFPALNLNKNANETLWVLMMQRGQVPLFLIFLFYLLGNTGGWGGGGGVHADSTACFDASGSVTPHILPTF